MAKYCYNCGCPLTGAEKFCENCGAKQPIQEQQPPQTEYGKIYGVAPRSAPNPPYPTEIPTRYAWALAVVPCLGSWFLLAVLGPDYSIFANTLCPIILNCIFVFLDIRDLKNSGYSPNNWIWLGLFLVPVYLFVRASKTDKKYGYAITWCVLFFFDLLLSGVFTPVVYTTVRIL